MQIIKRVIIHSSRGYEIRIIISIVVIIVVVVIVGPVLVQCLTRIRTETSELARTAALVHDVDSELALTHVGTARDGWHASARRTSVT